MTLWIQPIVFLIVLFQLGCAGGYVYREQELKEEDGFFVQYGEYLPVRDSSKKRGIVIMPPTGGATVLDKSYAKSLSRSGANVKVIFNWAGDDEESIELDIHQKLHSRAIRAQKIVMDSFPADFRVSVMGTSLGGDCSPPLRQVSSTARIKCWSLERECLSPML